MSELKIEACSLSRNFGSIVAVDRLSFEVGLRRSPGISRPQWRRKVHDDENADGIPYAEFGNRDHQRSRHHQ